MPLIMSGVRSVCRAPAVSKRLRPRASAPAPSAFSLARRHRHAYTHDTAMPTRRLPLRVGSTSHHLSHPHSSHTLAALSSHKHGGHRLAALPPHMLGGHRVGVSPAATGPVRSPVRSLFGFGKQSVLSATKDANTDQLKELLADADADKEESDMFGYRPIHHAVYSGKLEVVQLLIDSGVALHQKAGNNSVLHLVCDEKSEIGAGMAKALIEGGADVDHPGDKQVTPLHRALSKGNVDVGEILLANGADLEERNGHGCNAIEWATALAHRFDDFTLLNMIEDERAKRFEADPSLAARQQQLDEAAARVGYEPMDPRDHQRDNVFK